MYKALLFLHWKQIRWGLVPAVIASFGLPLVVVSGLGHPVDGTSLEAYQVVTEMNSWLLAFPTLAAAIGIVLALSAWNWDHLYGHVYALSLPVTRFEYVRNKMLAGFTLAAVPTLGLWLGAHLAVFSVSVPVGLNAYPNQLALRFFLAMLVFYALFFALGAGTKATTLKLLTGLLILAVVGSIGNDYLATYYPYFDQVHVIEAAMQLLVDAPGPFQVITGNWALIDV